MKEYDPEELEYEARDLKIKISQLERENADLRNGMLIGAAFTAFVVRLFHAHQDGQGFLDFLISFPIWALVYFALVLIGYVATAVIGKNESRSGRIITWALICAVLVLAAWAALT